MTSNFRVVKKGIPESTHNCFADFSFPLWFKTNRSCD